MHSSCQAGVAGLAIGDLGQCLQLTSLLPVLSVSFVFTKIVIDPLKTLVN